MQKPPPPDLTNAVRLRRELLAEGYTDQQLCSLVRARVLHRIRRGAYVERPLWDSLSREDQHRLLCRAVLRTSHPLTALSHISAAVERGTQVWGIPLDEVHTTRTDGKGARREAGVVHHVGDLREEDVEEVNGVRLTSAARSAVEVLTMATAEPALVVVNGMLHAGMMTLPELCHAAERMRYWPRTLSAHLVLAMADHRPESVAETRAMWLCHEHRLPRPVPQVPILDERGREFARVDLAWPSYGVFLEVDGRLKYEMHRREGETLEQFLMREKRREEQICQLTGWVCVRLTWADLENPIRTAARIRRVLDSRRPLGA
jgi:hypothetical protein